jgi:hypothetical protein
VTLREVLEDTPRSIVVEIGTDSPDGDNSDGQPVL